LFTIDVDGTARTVLIEDSDLTDYRGSWQALAPAWQPIPQDPDSEATDDAVDYSGSASVLQTAVDFLDAYSAYDADRAATYLSADALAELGGLEGLRLHRKWAQSHGYQVIVDACEVLIAASARTTVRCGYSFHAIRSDELGLGPFHDNHFLIDVSNGQVDAVRDRIDYTTNGFNDQMWVPFSKWVTEHHPDDVEVMYDDGLTSYEVSDESARLWERHSTEYVAVRGAEMIDAVERFINARNERDIDTALSLVTDDVWVDSTIGGGVSLNRDGLALALEVEQLLDVRFEDVSCAHVGGVVECSSIVQSRLHRADGREPTVFKDQFTFDAGGRIQSVWLDHLSYSPDGIPAWLAGFVTWLQAERPDNLEHIFTGCMEYRWCLLVLTRESIDLVAGLLDEYERSREG
jgi:hypothetical protein